MFDIRFALLLATQLTHLFSYNRSNLILSQKKLKSLYLTINYSILSREEQIIYIKRVCKVFGIRRSFPLVGGISNCDLPEHIRCGFDRKFLQKIRVIRVICVIRDSDNSAIECLWADYQGHSILWKTVKLPYDFGIPKHENPRPPRLPR